MSSVGAIASTNPLNNALAAAGLSSSKIKLVQNDMTDAIASSSSDGTVDRTKVRAALNKDLADDVAAGKLSKEDAAAITKVLDDADKSAQSSGGAPPGGGVRGGGGPGGGGGGAGGSAEKTEVSRAVVVAGGVATTTITYSDGTTETQTAPVNDVAPASKAEAAAVEKTKEEKAEEAPQEAQPEVGTAAQQWLAQIEPGTLVDKLA